MWLFEHQQYMLSTVCPTKALLHQLTLAALQPLLQTRPKARPAVWAGCCCWPAPAAVLHAMLLLLHLRVRRCGV